MQHLVLALVAWSLAYLLAGRNFSRLWKGGLIGAAITVLVDYLGTRYHFYLYAGGVAYIGELPLFHIVGMYAASMLYLNWLPRRRGGRILYTVIASAIFLAVESVMYSTGGIIYLHWKLWYSYFLLFAGLTLLACLSDLVLRHPLSGDSSG